MAAWMHLCRELEQRKQASLAARRMLLQANRGLVAKVVNQVNSYQHGRRNNCLSFEDSMEAGMAGMLKAILKFEPEVCCCADVWGQGTGQG
eukprot:1150739-Pelagomonas_calceolata.AAC.2